MEFIGWRADRIGRLTDDRSKLIAEIEAKKNEHTTATMDYCENVTSPGECHCSRADRMLVAVSNAARPLERVTATDEE
jgi:hypothetical protein